jgi:hypothetical protein
VFLLCFVSHCLSAWTNFLGFKSLLLLFYMWILIALSLGVLITNDEVRPFEFYPIQSLSVWLLVCVL